GQTGRRDDVDASNGPQTPGKPLLQLRPLRRKDRVATGVSGRKVRGHAVRTQDTFKSAADALDGGSIRDANRSKGHGTPRGHQPLRWLKDSGSSRTCAPTRTKGSKVAFPVSNTRLTGPAARS
ncbi:MAG: hypothetical protein M1423_06220, partial [Acidobacteria bacterium]|nr:hypothetical protein [Acidobacteriota bacterium]